MTNIYMDLCRIVASKVVQIQDLDRLKDTTKKHYKDGSLQKHGEIINNKTAPGQSFLSSSSLGRNILLDKDIGRTQYLIRFRAGVEGRKLAVHEWIFLEEHSIMVSISLAWVNLDLLGNQQHAKEGSKHCTYVAQATDTVRPKQSSLKNKEIKTQFRPIQLFVRTALERGAAVDELTFTTTANQPTSAEGNASSLFQSTPPMKIFGLFFGKMYHCAMINIGCKEVVVEDTHEAVVKNTHEVESIAPYSKRKDRRSKKSIIMGKVSSALESCVNGLFASTKQNLSLLPSPTKYEQKMGEEESSVACEEKKECEYHGDKKELTTGIGSGVLDNVEFDFIMADFINPPQLLKSHLEIGVASEEHLNVVLSLAVMEAEEQRRIRNQYK